MRRGVLWKLKCSRNYKVRSKHSWTRRQRLHDVHNSIRCIIVHHLVHMEKKNQMNWRIGYMGTLAQQNNQFHTLQKSRYAFLAKEYLGMWWLNWLPIHVLALFLKPISSASVAFLNTDLWHVSRGCGCYILTAMQNVYAISSCCLITWHYGLRKKHHLVTYSM